MSGLNGTKVLLCLLKSKGAKGFQHVARCGPYGMHKKKLKIYKKNPCLPKTCESLFKTETKSKITSFLNWFWSHYVLASSNTYSQLPTKAGFTCYAGQKADTGIYVKCILLLLRCKRKISKGFNCIAACSKEPNCASGKRCEFNTFPHQDQLPLGFPSPFPQDIYTFGPAERPWIDRPEDWILVCIPGTHVQTGQLQGKVGSSSLF